MAQPLQQDDVKQPGMDNSEGKEASTSSSLYPVHKFIIRDLSNSLYVSIENKKTKRIFSNSFSKSSLESMKLNGSITKIIHMINNAKSGNHDKFQFKFELLFGDAESDKTELDKMSKSYSKGSCIFMVISVDEFFMSGVWVFKLPEKKREETDILRDIIEDLQNEVTDLRKQLQEQKANPMAVWKSTRRTTNFSKNTRWDIEVMPPSHDGLAKRENNNEDIVIGIGGWYRVSIRFGWNSSSEATYIHYLRLNRNKNICIVSGFNMVEVVKLKKGDTLDFHGPSCGQWTPECNSFTLELLKKE